MKDRLYKWERLPFYDGDRIARRLEERAEQGWMLENPGSLLWRYRKTTPRKLTFAVTYFPKAAQVMEDPTPEWESMTELCSRDGWQLAAHWGQMQIFYNEQEDPEPIETDLVTRVENIRRAMKSSRIRSELSSMFSIGLLTALELVQIHLSPDWFLVSNLHILLLPALLLMLASSIACLGGYFLWVRKAAAAAEQGIWLSPGVNWVQQVLSGLGSILLLAGLLSSPLGFYALGTMALVLVCLVGGALLLGRSLNRWKISRRKSVLILSAVGIAAMFAGLGLTARQVISKPLPADRKPVEVVHYKGGDQERWEDEIPLRAEELLGAEAEKWSTHAQPQVSFLLTRTEYNQSSMDGGWPTRLLEYTLVETKYDWVYNHYKSFILKNRDEVRDGEVVYMDHYEAVDPRPWGADEVYQRWTGDAAGNMFLLCWEGRMAEIPVYNQVQELTGEQMALIGQKLGPEN